MPVSTPSRTCSRSRLAPGLIWTSAKGAYAQPVAEHALALTLALLRVLPKRVRRDVSWSTEPEGRSLYGLNVVIIGAGGIALELMRLLEPFDAHITIVRRSAEPVAGRRAVTVPVGPARAMCFPRRTSWSSPPPSPAARGTCSARPSSPR